MALLDLAETVCGAIKHLVLKTDSIDVPGVRGVNPDCPLMVRPVSAQIMKALSQVSYSTVEIYDFQNKLSNTKSN